MELEGLGSIVEPFRKYWKVIIAIIVLGFLYGIYLLITTTTRVQF